MADHTMEDSISTRKDALQALGVMTAALFVGTMVWQEGPRALLWVFSFCLFLMTLVSTTLFVIEGRLHRDQPDPTIKFCRPALFVLGFSTGLFFAAGFVVSAMLVLGLAMFLAAYRRRALAGDFNLIPSAALNLGLIGGLGVAVAGLFLLGINSLTG